MPGLTRVALLGLLLMGGCGSGYSAVSHLPEWVSASVRFQDGTHGSVLVSLGTPRSPPEVRYASGLWVFDGSHLIEVAPALRGVGGLVDLRVRDRLVGSEQIFDLGVSADALAVNEVVSDHIAFVAGDTLHVRHPHTGEQAACGGGCFEDHHFGPGRGFSLSVSDGVASLELPRAEEGVVLFQDVERVISLAWIRPVHLTDGAMEFAQRLFKGVLPIRPGPGEAVADGDLVEWRGARVLAVDSEAVVLGGLESWTGARDGSFGVAARVHAGRLHGAVRIRDDVLSDGDRVELELGERLWTLAVRGPGPFTGAADLRAAFTDAVSFGTGLEISVPAPPQPATPEPLPLVVRYIDEDPGQGATTLASAPSLRALAISATY